VIPELDIWRIANLMNKRYADKAKANSDRRAEELAGIGDHAGVAVWHRIADAIEQLTKRSLQDHCTDQGARGLEQRTESHPTGRQSKLIAAIVNVETTGPNPKRDKIVELGIARF
jgi:hypothetical protein